MSQLQVIKTLQTYLQQAEEGKIDGIIVVATKGQSYVSHGLNFDTEYFPIILASMNATARKVNALWDQHVFQRADDEVTVENPNQSKVEGLGNAKVTRDDDGNVTVTLDEPQQDDEEGSPEAE